MIGKPELGLLDFSDYIESENDSIRDSESEEEL
jgi:hypothetical protein